MSAPFIALTLQSFGGLGPQPIFINAALIRTVNQYWKRKADHTGPVTPDSFDCIGSWVCVGDGEDGTFGVAESYGEVTGAIRDALA